MVLLQLKSDDMAPMHAVYAVATNPGVLMSLRIPHFESYIACASGNLPACAHGASTLLKKLIFTKGILYFNPIQHVQRQELNHAIRNWAVVRWCLQLTSQLVLPCSRT
jgi:hypothetical protein